MNSRIRDYIDRARDGSMPSQVAFGAGYDEFLPELLGMHRADAARLYISDGGHYDNTGLIALLIGRCETIWCVDSEADKKGRAGQLREVIAFAQDELGIAIDLNVEQFRADDMGFLGVSHAIGTSQSPIDLQQYREEDAIFPHHGTFTHIAFAPERLDAYRRLGTVNANAAMDAEAASSDVAPADSQPFPVTGST